MAGIRPDIEAQLARMTATRQQVSVTLPFEQLAVLDAVAVTDFGARRSRAVEHLLGLGLDVHLRDREAEQ